MTSEASNTRSPSDLTKLIICGIGGSSQAVFPSTWVPSGTQGARGRRRSRAMAKTPPSPPHSDGSPARYGRVKYHLYRRFYPRGLFLAPQRCPHLRQTMRTTSAISPLGIGANHHSNREAIPKPGREKSPLTDDEIRPLRRAAIAFRQEIN